MGRQPPEIFEPVENNLNLKGRGFRRSLIGKVNAEEVVAIEHVPKPRIRVGLSILKSVRQ